MGVPIENKVNEVFLKSPKIPYVTRHNGLKSTSEYGLLYRGPIEDKANKVNLEYEAHRMVLQSNLSENTSDFRLLYGHAYSK